MLIAINKRLEAFRRNEKGFTMLEVLMVLVVLGIVAAVFGSQLFSSADPAERRADELVIQRLNSAYDVFVLDGGVEPADGSTANFLVPNHISQLPDPPRQGGTFRWNATTDTFEIRP